MSRICLLFLLVCALPALRLSAGEEKPAARPLSADSGTLTGILGAMQLEVSILTEALENPVPQTVQQLKFTTGKLNGRNVVVAKAGIGKTNAAFTAALLLERFKPAEVLVTGIAGGLNPELGPADIVVAEKIAHHDFGNLTAQGLESKGTRNPVTGQRNPIFFPGDARLLGLADVSAARLKLEPLKTATGERTPKIIKGTVVTGDVFVAHAEKSAALRKDFNADAVEMEGASIAQVCFQQGVPCLVIRSLSDMADATAVKDSANFNKIAAGNSAKLVRDIVAQLANEPARKP